MNVKKVLLFIISCCVVFSVASFEVFADEPSGWAKAEIDKGILDGTIHQDLNSDYKKDITRSDFAKLLVHMYVKSKGFESVEDLLDSELRDEYSSYDYSFTDVDYDSLDSKYIVAANILGFVSGTSESTFSPNNNLTREQAAKMLVSCYVKMLEERDIDYTEPSSFSSFKDNASISKWAIKSVYAAKELGVMKGVGNGNFDPKQGYSREQAAVTVFRLDEIATENIEREYALRKQQGTLADSQKKNDSEDEVDPEIYSKRQEVIELVNIEREKVGIPPVVDCERYDDYANIRAQEIVNKFSHERPDGSCCFSGVMDYRGVGENIAAGQSTAEMVMDDWMSSEGHRVNILNPTFEELGVGIYHDDSSEYKWYWVQIFYTPMD